MLDTNVIVSALLGPGSASAFLVKSALDGTIQLVVSPPLLAELRRVIERPRIVARVRETQDERTHFVDAIERRSRTVYPVVSVSASRDPDDDRVLEAAVAGGADYVVTGDDDLLTLGQHAGIPIVTAAAFVRLLRDER